MKKDYFFIGTIVVFALVVILLIGTNTGALYNMPKSVHADDAGSIAVDKGAVGRAISVIETGTFNYGGEGYIGGGQRGPGYVLVLASLFLVFGQYVGVVYVLNIILFILSLILTWRIGLKFLPYYWAFLPSLALSVFPSVVARAWSTRYEVFSLFLATSAILLLLSYKETGKISKLIAGAFLFSVWALERPIVLYFFPVVVVFLLVWKHSSLSPRKVILHASVFIMIACAIIGLWSFRNYKVLHTWQIGSGGHLLLLRSTQIDYSPKELMFLATSYAVGDFIGGKIYQNYPTEFGPSAYNDSVLDRWFPPRWIIEDVDGEVLNRVELDRKMYNEALTRIKQHPIKFILAAPVNFLRLNAPVNYKGQEIMRMFMGESSLPESIKIAIIFTIRVLWLLFLFVSLYAAIKHLKEWKKWGFLLLLILYYNGMYSLLTHAEARYIMTSVPFYLIFFAEGVRLLYLCFFSRFSFFSPLSSVNSPKEAINAG